MTLTVKKNLYVTLALYLAVAVLVALEVRVLVQPPSAAWGIAIFAASLGGFAWANLNAFPTLAQPKRGAAIGALVAFIWLAAVFFAVVFGVNLKFALGGHV